MVTAAATLAPEAEIAELTSSVRSELFHRLIDERTTKPSEAQIKKMMRYADLVVQMGGTHEEFYKTAINLILTTAERQLGLTVATNLLADVIAFDS